jgi:hypothetical protein
VSLLCCGGRWKEGAPLCHSLLLNPPSSMDKRQLRGAVGKKE